MDDHPCGECLRWPECNGVNWGTDECPKNQLEEERRNDE